MAHLESGQDVAVRQPQERVRVRVALDVAELAGHTRFCGIRQVEDEALSRPEAVGEQLSIRGHLMFGVMRRIAPSGHRQRGHQSSITCTAFRDIEHGKEVGLCRIFRRGP